MLKIQLKNADALASKNCRNGNAKKNNVEIGNHGNINTEMQYCKPSGPTIKRDQNELYYCHLQISMVQAWP